MFRLIATNTQAGLRPVLLRKVRGNSSSLKLASNVNLEPSFDFQNYFAIQISRNNSTKGISVSDKSEKLGNSVKIESVLSKPETKAPINPEILSKVKKFSTILAQATEKGEAGKYGRYSNALSELQKLFADDEVKEHLNKSVIFSYAAFLDEFILFNRNNRLSYKQNRDSDHYKNQSLNNDIILKSAILDMADGILRNKIHSKIKPRTLTHLFSAMIQSESFAELVELWEAGVNSNEGSSTYLTQDVLTAVLPVAYKIKRFSYEEICKIYDYNTKGKKVDLSLETSMGKIAIRAGDNSRGLDIMEELMKQYEKKPKNASLILHHLGDLHLNFIGHCQDIKIARHFYDKVVDSELPYRVVLKAPYVVSLFNNCYEAKEPFTNIATLWKQAIDFYNRGNERFSYHSRYSILNNSFFKIFFSVYPKYTEEGYDLLKGLIKSYDQIKDVDEILLNSIITNYNWEKKLVLQELLENFDKYPIERTPVSYRVCLKKMGEVEDYSNEEILAQWDKNVQFLDMEGYTYIPIADWAALRDCTIMSPFSEKRTSIYLEILNAYKNFHQDARACLRFSRWWLPRTHVAGKVAALSFSDDIQTDCDIDIRVPEFHSLKKNVDYKKVTKPIFENSGFKSSQV
ncbi:hypothetical protein CJI97_002974 [Candidozyma auris]|uniref:Protein RMD9, mitochondrial n=1 Tax=Candidozyma auris TaxID=498019 RepID=A0A2H0ZLW8_CANAR|nr:hypothetical_protein [[Candida] auris]PIS51322.1 hypothetical protein B9J08_002900 [[Candida] auris]PIS53309.1 hypothetical protein CJI97_002974 [[Candida] auris]QEO19951.1 hypothetical_protein [[Candida] auris]GBL50069.1 hypothetical protein CAJCM15448_23430 [[Candida] auris]